MSPNANEPIDLANAESWCGIRPGMSRAEVTRILEGAEVALCEDDDDSHWVLASGEEWAMELRFAPEGENLLRQIVVDHDECRWAGRAVLGRPLHEVIAAIGSDTAQGAGWRPEDANANLGIDELQPPGPGPFTDEALLDGGTLWLPRRNLGLIMCGGTVSEVAWRMPDFVPRERVGPFTEAQRKLSADPDLDATLRKSWVAQNPATVTPARPWTPAQRLVTLLFVAALGYLGWLSWEETQRWQNFVTLPAKLLSIEEPSNPRGIPRYRLSYLDPAGEPQTAVLERGEFYISPREIGEEVQIAYSAKPPARAMGLARTRDAAFIRYTPWFIGVVAVYIILFTIAGFLRRLQRPAAEPKSGPPNLPMPPGLQG